MSNKNWISVLALLRMSGFFKFSHIFDAYTGPVSMMMLLVCSYIHMYNYYLWLCNIT